MTARVPDSVSDMRHIWSKSSNLGSLQRRASHSRLFLSRAVATSWLRPRALAPGPALEPKLTAAEEKYSLRARVAEGDRQKRDSGLRFSSTSDTFSPSSCGLHAVAVDDALLRPQAGDWPSWSAVGSEQRRREEKPSVGGAKLRQEVLWP
ncbi:hypothetical protein JZ751_018415 [Albula glossodonta]|uniref:Uncharacterized protein n=1 Tax=Albula glossodonta TaxID=121402 RepID=A0A8T2MJY7_9TELE|nr:hypothetical protein JZ751_018415 [Albula glossodonta]